MSLACVSQTKTLPLLLLLVDNAMRDSGWDVRDAPTDSLQTCRRGGRAVHLAFIMPPLRYPHTRAADADCAGGTRAADRAHVFSFGTRAGRLEEGLANACRAVANLESGTAAMPCCDALPSAGEGALRVHLC